MFVYADATSEIAAGALIQRLQREEQPRDLLITAGQLEQVVFDADSPATEPGLRNAVMEFTDLAASVFLGRESASQLRGSARDLGLPRNLPLRVKSPEGFAHYALFPEQYALAAERWIRDHAAHHQEPVLVVGLRSIGTTLSAVVAQVLRNAGWNVRRLTLRPTGHPYDRRVDLQQEAIGPATFGLIVDEGPGRSGSSMAGAAQAFQHAGLNPSRLSFFPGHLNGPGPEASSATRQWWRNTRCYHASLFDVTWDGRTLPGILSSHAGLDLPSWQDLSAGQWRSVVFPNPSDWPPAWTAFERLKFRTGPVLWKFAGFSGASEAGHFPHRGDGATGLDPPPDLSSSRLRRHAMDHRRVPPPGTRPAAGPPAPTRNLHRRRFRRPPHALPRPASSVLRPPPRNALLEHPGGSGPPVGGAHPAVGPPCHRFRTARRGRRAARAHRMAARGCRTTLQGRLPGTRNRSHPSRIAAGGLGFGRCHRRMAP